MTDPTPNIDDLPGFTPLELELAPCAGKILGLSIEADANFWESPTEAYEAAADLLIAAGKNAEGVRAALARYRASAGTPLTSAGAVPLPCQPAPPSLASRFGRRPGVASTPRTAIRTGPLLFSVMVSASR